MPKWLSLFWRALIFLSWKKKGCPLYAFGGYSIKAFA